jgi:hypothetical protein
MILTDNASTLAGSDPLIWTPSAVGAEFKRVLAVLDSVNMDVSAAQKAGKITGAEWNSWYSVYLGAHAFVTTASTLWGSNVAVARQHEQEAGKWRDLVKSRGQAVQGPDNLIRQDEVSGVSYWTGAAVIGGVVVGGILVSKIGSIFKR